MPRLKIIVEDYTQLPPKIKILRGETGECPRCKRIGVIENRDGQIAYFHQLGYVFIEDEQLPGIVDDTCSNLSVDPKTVLPKEVLR
jgi:hypothetical protein